MRIAALYDIHGNLPALDAALLDVARAGVDLVVIGGDVVPGPMVEEVLDRLDGLAVPTTFIRGNCESELIATRDGRPAAVPPAYQDLYRWFVDTLPPAVAKRMESWPATASVDVDGLGRVLFCHGTPRDDNEIVTSETPEALAGPMFGGVQAALVVCGHTHMPFDRRVSGLRVVNPGSVGMSFGDAGAFWLLIDGAEIMFRRTDYDLEAAAGAIRATAYPQAEEFVTKYLLERPAADRMRQIFTAASMRVALPPPPGPRGSRSDETPGK